MKTLLKTVFIAGTIALAIPSLANARGYKTTISSPLETAVKVEVVMSEEMQHRANNLPTKSGARNFGQTRGIRKGFATNGFLGERELERLSASLERKITKRLTKKGLDVSSDAPVTLKITVEDAKNNRPTQEQLTRDTGLSFKSFAIGGAEMSAELIDQSGNSLGTMHYKNYASNIQQNQQFVSTWFEAERTFDWFARRAAKTLAN